VRIFTPICIPTEPMTLDSPLTDCSYSISTNLFGAKLWHLFPPTCTPYLLPLIAQAEREGSSVDVRDWDEARLRKMGELGMRVVRQEQGETIFSESRREFCAC
jgi:hypothetical protein